MNKTQVVARLRHIARDANRLADELGQGEMSDLQRRTFELATRKGGVTRPELRAVSKNIGWKAYLQRTGASRGYRLQMSDAVTYQLIKD